MVCMYILDTTIITMVVEFCSVIAEKYPIGGDRKFT